LLLAGARKGRGGGKSAKMISRDLVKKIRPAPGPLYRSSQERKAGKKKSWGI